MSTDPDVAAALNAQAAQLESDWGANGTKRVLAHTVIGGLTGGFSSAAGAAAGTLTAPTVLTALTSAGIRGPLADTLTVLASTAAGAAVGEAGGAAAAGNEVMKRYLNDHRRTMMNLSEREQYDAALAACDAKDLNACDRKSALADLSRQRDIALAQACAGTTPGLCKDKKNEAIAMGNRVYTTDSGVTYANSPKATPLNVATIGIPANPRQGTFQDAAARSTSEALLLTASDQAVGAVIGLAARAGASLSRAAAEAAVNMIETMGLRNVQVGAISNFQTAEAVNVTMKSVAGWEPAWQPGTMVADVTLNAGSRVNMVVTKAEYNAIINAPDTARFGGWATYDAVPTQAYARTQLAITEQMKGSVDYVIQVEITKPLYAQVGVVGEQGVATGGGNQLHFVLPATERTNVFKYIANSGRALP